MVTVPIEPLSRRAKKQELLVSSQRARRLRGVGRVHRHGRLLGLAIGPRPMTLLRRAPASRFRRSFAVDIAASDYAACVATVSPATPLVLGERGITRSSA
jgi:hypothetical protein